MLGFILLGLVKCSVIKEYHAFYYDMITEHSELCAILTIISLMVLFVGHVSPFISLIPIVTMVLKYATTRLLEYVNSSENVSIIFGSYLDSLKDILEGTDKFALAIPLLSIMVSYIIMSLVELGVFFISVLLIYVAASSLNVDLKTDIYLVTLGTIFLFLLGIFLIYIMRKIQNIMILFGCCNYYAFYFLTCCDIAGISNFDMKNFFSRSQKRSNDISDMEIVILIISFTSVLVQCLLYPALSATNEQHKIEPVQDKKQKKCKLEPSNDRLDRLHYENSVLKSRLETLERKLHDTDES